MLCSVRFLTPANKIFSCAVRLLNSRSLSSTLEKCANARRTGTATTCYCRSAGIGLVFGMTTELNKMTCWTGHGTGSVSVKGFGWVGQRPYDHVWVNKKNSPGKSENSVVGKIEKLAMDPRGIMQHFICNVDFYPCSDWFLWNSLWSHAQFAKIAQSMPSCQQPIIKEMRQTQRSQLSLLIQENIHPDIAQSKNPVLTHWEDNFCLL
jgi:hypothetical protein